MEALSLLVVCAAAFLAVRWYQTGKSPIDWSR